MKKFWQVVSKKDLIFGLIILALTILISLKPSNKVRIQFDETSVDIVTTKFSMNIPYDMVSHLELADLPELGKNVDGYNNQVIQTGLWRNGTWGEYHACLDLACETCIVVHLNDGRIFVISLRNPEETAASYEEFLTHLA